jgi:hypothetical protein
MKRGIALIVSAMAALVAAAVPAAAAPAAPATTAPSASTVPANAIGLEIANVTTPGLAVTVDPGATDNHDLVISNHTSDLRLTVKLVATDATGNIASGAAQWIAFENDEVQLDPHSATTDTMTVAIPHDTQPSSILVHVVATIANSVSAADGSPRPGAAKATFPLSITINGSPTAQVAIADVHRVDEGSKHQLAVVLRNFSNDTPKVEGTVRVNGDHPQKLTFTTDLPAGRDTTMSLPWNAPPVSQVTEVAIELKYGSNVAQWSSVLGGAPTSLEPSPAEVTTPSTTPAQDPAQQPQAPVASADKSKPWWQTLLPFGIVLAILAAGAWFVWEMRRSKEREREMPMGYGPPWMMMPWGAPPGAGSDATAELAKQLVRLTEVIVELTTNRDASVHPPARAGPATNDPDPPVKARAPDEEAAPPPVVPTDLGLARSASPTPGDESRPETETRAPTLDELTAAAQRRLAEAEALRAEIHNWQPPEPEPEPPTAMERLLELDRQRRMMRKWMDAEEAADFGWAQDARDEPTS